MDEKLKAQMRERKKLRMKEAIRRRKSAHNNIDNAKPTRAPVYCGKARKNVDHELWAEARAEVKAEVQPITNRNRSKGMKKYHAKKREEATKDITVEDTIAAQEKYEDDIARRELAQRTLCRKRLMAYVLRFNDAYLAGWVHKDICARLERFLADVEAGKSPRLMIQMPPRHGKSTLASQEFPSWVLGHHPNWEIMSCSYAESLALDFSRSVRERLRDPEYHVLFPKAKIDPDNQNAKGWKTTKKGGLMPAGVQGPLTGKGAHILIIDDPVKNDQEAESELTREGIARWYESTAYTRLAPGGGVLIIQTRWHLDDLSGRLEHKMSEGRGDVFEIVRYPAEAVEDEKYRKQGDPLHEARYNSAQLKMIKQAVGRRTWAALYQQNPVPDEGAMFQASMMQYYNQDQLPEELTFVTCWDLAIGQKEVNDRTVGMTWGKDVTGDFWFVDCRRGHWDAYDIVAEICDQFEKFRSFFTGVEKDKIAMAVGPYLDTEIENRELYSLHVEELPPAREGNKQHRARSLQGLMRRGRVWLPNPDEAPWVSEFVSELLQFPYGRRDDHVDVAAWLALQAADTPAPGLNYSRVPRRDSWRDRLRGAMRGTKSMMSS